MVIHECNYHIEFETLPRNTILYHLIKQSYVIHFPNVTRLTPSYFLNHKKQIMELFHYKAKLYQLPGELNFNEKYNSTYMNAHKTYHSTFDSYLNNFHLYDIFIADMKGNLVYTDFKEKDFATNLKSGVYSNSGIAKVYNKYKVYCICISSGWVRTALPAIYIYILSFSVSFIRIAHNHRLL